MLLIHNPLDKSKLLDQNYYGEKRVRDEVLQMWTAGHFSLHISVTARNLQRGEVIILSRE